MIVLVANLGSTSFKCKLYQMDPSRHTLLGQGVVDRIGMGQSHWSATVREQKASGTADLADHAAAIELHLQQLVDLGALETVEQLEAIGFKAVHGGSICDPVRIDERVLAIMEQFADVAPQHNRPYIDAMRAFAKSLPHVPQVAAFESGFHQTIPLARQVYGIPHEWTEKLGIRRYGFHGASHRYIATRMAQIAPHARRLISCHLGGSCSICAIRDGTSQANSFGMTAQSGVFHSSRVGDFDTFALLKLLAPPGSGATGPTLDLETVFRKLGKEAGLAGLSGVSSDMRQVKQAAIQGNRRAQLAIDAFVESCRHYVGAYLAVLNGADALVFTGGIGQHDPQIRQAICTGMQYAGIRCDAEKNREVHGDAEARIDATDSQASLWIVPTDEELIVARQTVTVLGEEETERQRKEAMEGEKRVDAMR